MSRHTFPLGRVLGIPLELDYSWFLVFALLTWALAVGHYPAEFKGWPPSLYWIMGAVTAVMLFVSVLLHELGHSVVARRYKIPVRQITLFIFGGVSQIEAEAATPGADFRIAVAGPLVSLALAGLFTILQPAVAGVSPLLALARYLAYINLALAFFNLIPGFPLDGGRGLRAIVWGLTGDFRRATRFAASVGRGFAFVFILAGVWQVFGGNVVGGLWIAFIGWFLESAAVAQTQQVAVQDLLGGHTVAEAMSRDLVAVPRDATLQQLVDQHILTSGRRSFLVQRDQAVLGLLTLHHVVQIPRAQWGATTAEQAMIPVARMRSAHPDAELRTALEDMDRDGVNQLPVMMDHRALGILRREDIISFLRVAQQLHAGQQ
jgi:Zn-dependent protease/CBS domain-containing protein